MKKRNGTMRNTTTEESDKDMRRAAVYVMAHKPFAPPPDPLYVPLHVGRAVYMAEHGNDASPLFSYQGDDSGRSISAKNGYYSELTGLYWVWKNVRTPYVGVCHYRRYLLHESGGLFTEAQIMETLQRYDVITTKELQLNFPYEKGFAAHHKPVYLQTVGAVLAERYPEYRADWERLVRGTHTYFGNMLIARKETYDAYLAWLFSILEEVERRVPVEEEDSYHRRIFGFLSEFLQYVWIRHNQLRVCECMVGMFGEKAEIRQVREALAGYFARADADGAKNYFLAARRARPDLLMEASDVTGELHLCMEVIAIAGLEQEAYGTNLLVRIGDFGELMRYCNRLNRYVLQEQHGGADEQLLQWRRSTTVTEVAENVARRMIPFSHGHFAEKCYNGT